MQVYSEVPSGFSSSPPQSSHSQNYRKPVLSTLRNNSSALVHCMAFLTFCWLPPKKISPTPRTPSHTSLCTCMTKHSQYLEQLLYWLLLHMNLRGKDTLTHPAFCPLSFLVLICLKSSFSDWRLGRQTQVLNPHLIIYRDAAIWFNRPKDDIK